jgi:hypothetical protein
MTNRTSPERIGNYENSILIEEEKSREELHRKTYLNDSFKGGDIG